MIGFFFSKLFEGKTKNNFSEMWWEQKRPLQRYAPKNLLQKRKVVFTKRWYCLQREVIWLQITPPQVVIPIKFNEPNKLHIFFVWFSFLHTKLKLVLSWKCRCYSVRNHKNYVESINLSVNWLIVRLTTNEFRCLRQQPIFDSQIVYLIS